MSKSNGSANRLSIARLRELLTYDPETGVFRWLVSWPIGFRCPGRKVPILAGDVVGCNSSGYRVISIHSINYQEHRLAWAFVHGAWPKGVIDHRDRVKSHNLILNLRDTSCVVNAQNQGTAPKHSKSGILGVYPSLTAGKWCATIFANRRQRHLGTFDDSGTAHQAYLAAKRQLHEGCMI